MILDSFLALIATMLATSLVYLGWRNSATGFSFAGWSGLVACIGLWCATLGTEFGLTIGLTLPAVLVWGGILREAAKQHGGERVRTLPVKPAHRRQLAPRHIAKNTAHALYLLPGQLFICALIMIALVYQLPVSEPKQMAIGVLMMPVLWGVLAYGYMMSKRKLMYVGMSLACALVAGLWLFGGMHG